MDWKIRLVKAGKWVRSSDPYGVTVENRVHVVPISLEAIRFLDADAYEYPRGHLSFIGWNHSWVMERGVRVRAYRSNSDDMLESRRRAKIMVGILDVAMKVLKTRRPIEHVGFSVFSDK